MANPEAPKTLHGLPVVLAVQVPGTRGESSRFVVLVQTQPLEWVVAEWWTGDEDWNHGHYFLDAFTAAFAFVERCKRVPGFIA